MTWDKKVASIIAICGTVVVKLLGGWDMAIYVLLLFMAIDYVTGIMRAVTDKELSSEIGIKGIFKKIMILLLVAIAVGVDNVTGTQGAIRMLVILFYVGMEGISVLENSARLGVPVPERLKDVLLQIKEGGKKEPVIVRTVNQNTIETIDGVTTETNKEVVTETTSKEVK